MGSAGSSFMHIFHKLLTQMTRKQQRVFWLMVGAMVVSGMLETIAIGAIAVFIHAIAAPHEAGDIIIVQKFQRMLSMDCFINSRDLIVCLSMMVLLLIMIKNTVKALISYGSSLYSAMAATYVGRKLFSGFLNASYEWHLSKNPANLSISVLWRIFISRLIDAFLGALSEALMVIVLLTSIVVMAPVVSIMVIGVLGMIAWMIDRFQRKKLSRTARLNKDYQHMINRHVSSIINAIKDVTPIPHNGCRPPKQRRV